MSSQNMAFAPDLADLGEDLTDPGLAVEPSANDTVAGPPATAVDRTSLYAALSDRRLRERLVAHLVARKEVVPHRAEDIVQTTYLRAMRARSWPSDPAKMFAWMKAIAERTFVDDVRKRDRREAVETLHDDVDVVVEAPEPREALRVAEAAESVAAESPYDAATLAMLEEEAAAEPVAEIVAQRDISRDAYYVRKARFIARVRARLVELASVTTSSVALLLVLHTILAITAVTLVADAPPGPKAGDPLPRLESHGDAASLRHRGLRLCRARDYARCVELLDEARALDPIGDLALDVTEAREAAETVLHHAAAPLPR